MKYIIDLIQDIREELNNSSNYNIKVMLLKESDDNPEQLINAGESPLNRFNIDHNSSTLKFYIDGTNGKLNTGDILKEILILDMSSLMYEIKIDINIDYSDIEVIGFGKATNESSYFLFIKL